MKDTDFLDEIKTTLVYSDEVSHSLFSGILGKSFQGIKDHYHTMVPGQSVGGEAYHIYENVEYRLNQSLL